MSTVSPIPPSIMSANSGPGNLSTLTPPASAAITAQAPGANPGADQVKGLMAMGESIDKALAALAQAAPIGAAEFGVARDFVKQGLAKVAVDFGQAVPSSAESTGNQFPTTNVGQGF